MRLSFTLRESGPAVAPRRAQSFASAFHDRLHFIDFQSDHATTERPVCRASNNHAAFLVRCFKQDRAMPIQQLDGQPDIMALFPSFPVVIVFDATGPSTPLTAAWRTT